MKKQTEAEKRQKEKRTWWEKFKAAPTQVYRVLWSSNKKGTAKLERHESRTVTCRVYSKTLGRHRELTKVTITTTPDRKWTPEGKAKMLARHRVARCKRVIKWVENLVIDPPCRRDVLHTRRVCDLPLSDLEFVIDLT